MASTSTTSTPDHIVRLDQFGASLTHLLHQLESIRSEQSKHAKSVEEFCHLIQRLRIYHRYIQMLQDVTEHDLSRKRLCIKYKDLDLELLRQVRPENICWKYLWVMVENFQKHVSPEFAQVLQNFEYYGDYEFSEYFSTRIFLLIKIVDQFTELLACGILVDKADPLQAEEETDEALRAIKEWIKPMKAGDLDTITRKYQSLGLKIKTMKVSFNQAHGSFYGMCLRFPYLFLCGNKMESLANEFFCSPTENILSNTWNAIEVTSILLRLFQLSRR